MISDECRQSDELWGNKCWMKLSLLQIEGNNENTKI